VGSTAPSPPVADGDAPLRLPLGLGLRPRRPTALLDAGFEVVRFRFFTVIAVVLVIQLPLVVLPSLVSTFAALDRARQFVEPQSEPIAAGGFNLYATDVGVWGWVTVVGGLLSVALAGVALTHLLTSWSVGRDPGVGETLGVVARRLPVVLAAWLMAIPIRVLGAAVCGVGLLFAVAWLFVVSPVIASEPVGPWRAIKRSFHLTGRRLGPVLGLVCMVAIVAGILEAVVDGIAAAVSAGEDVSTLVVLLVTIGSLLVTLGLTALHGAWSALAYLDLRVRVEGLDLLLAAPAELDPTPRRWAPA